MHIPGAAVPADPLEHLGIAELLHSGPRRRLRDVDSELFDISYVRCDSRLVEQKVEEHAEVRTPLPQLLP
jgi:hypothetical protein